jgi:hypothetical protein
MTVGFVRIFLCIFVVCLDPQYISWSLFNIILLCSVYLRACCCLDMSDAVTLSEIVWYFITLVFVVVRAYFLTSLAAFQCFTLRDWYVVSCTYGYCTPRCVLMSSIQLTGSLWWSDGVLYFHYTLLVILHTSMTRNSHYIYTIGPCPGYLIFFICCVLKVLSINWLVHVLAFIFLTLYIR